MRFFQVRMWEPENLTGFAGDAGNASGLQQDFQEFKKVLPSMEGVHYLKADGTEVYGVYKHDVCYVERDGVKRTLQMIVPEMKQDKNYTYPAILYVQGSA